MARNDGLATRVEDHERRIASLEKLLGSKEPKKPAPKAGNAKSLPQIILRLRDDDGFFSKPQTGADAHAEVIKGYHCDKNRLDVALLRMANAGELRKTSKTVDGRKFKAYVW